MIKVVKAALIIAGTFLGIQVGKDLARTYVVPAGS